ncbi:multicopper oxidase domain-containing protein [Agrococcus sp. KRD186]|uniref:multicopper oxidase domain-containing protein n=1 Tax=Agrococcus sp. KRD186 TaxID=2729730 RepID=UPI0019D1BF8A|nr:multicopper oxidase domain-containing protein [Agrococcus sp. KRD186]
MRAASTTRGFQPLRDLPTVLWLLLLVLVTIAHRDLPAPRWLMLHVLLLGAATHAILVWSQYFSFALLRSKQSSSDRSRQTWRLALSNAGAALVVIGVPLGVWPVTVAGAALLIAAVAWHAASLVSRLRGALAGRFGRTVRYYVAAAAFLIVGASLGTWLAGGFGADRERLVLAHALINLLGWVGLTVTGTLVTLWPTMLRTRADEQAGPSAARALPVLAVAAAVATAGAALGASGVLALGLLGYAAGLVLIAIGMVRAARSAPPRSFAAGSAGMAVLWGVGTLLALAGTALHAWSTGADFVAVRAAMDAVVPYAAAGFVAQVLIGALSYLVPVVLGGGPTPVRTGTRALDRGGALRIATANVALVVCALPVSSLMRVIASMLYLIAVGSFLPLLVIAMRAQRRAKQAQAAGAGAAPVAGAASVAGAAQPAAARRRGPIAPEGERPAGQRSGQAVAGLLAVVLAVVIAAAVQPQDLGLTAPPAGAAAAAQPTAESAPVQTVEVSAADMRFTPSRIEVPAGTRLVIELTNADAEIEHDLVLDTGVRSPRLAPGEHASIDAGIVTAGAEGWCSVIGHRQMGMTLAIVVTGEPGGATAPDAAHHHSAAGAGDGGDASAAGDGHDASDAVYDPMAEPGAGFTARDAALPPLPPPADGPVTHRETLTVTEQVVEVAPGVRQTLWTFDGAVPGTAPGPTLHGRVGDRFEITLVNDGTIGHSIDFHAGALAPDEPMRTIGPGEALTYAFTAERAGIWMYHCATMPMSAHIANGMFGAVVIEPEGLPEVDRSYVLVQSELYLGPQDGEVDVAQLATGQPDIVAFNGYARQYEHAPLAARVGERVRVWLLDAGVARPSSFHVVGGQFDTTWAEGDYLLDAREGGDGGAQALALQPAQGGFVELVFPEAGHYPFLSHVMIDADRGAQGVFEVAQ